MKIIMMDVYVISAHNIYAGAQFVGPVNSVKFDIANFIAGAGTAACRV